MTNQNKKTNLKKAQSILGLLVLAVGGIAINAYAQTPGDLMSRLDRLETDIQTLNRAVYKKDSGAMDAIGQDQAISDGQARAQTEVRLQQMDKQISELRGLIEQQGYEIKKMSETLERTIGDMDMRLGDIEQGRAGSNANDLPASSDAPLTSSSGAMTETETPALESANNNSITNDNSAALSSETSTTTDVKPSTSSLSVPDDKAAAMYENAFALLKGGKYEQAGAEFSSFLKLYSTHVLASNAKYWLGESFYVRGDYERAARIFAEGYKNYPDGPKTADNLLKLGLSLSAANNQADACIAFEQLKKDFGSAPTPTIRSAEQAMKKIGCDTQ